jgi:hypothetical protein
MSNEQVLQDVKGSGGVDVEMKREEAFENSRINFKRSKFCRFHWLSQNHL